RRSTVLNGADGIDGAVGPQGLIGLTGANGADGVDGAVGPQGPTGLTGLTGADGATGPQGLIGLTGAIGPQGPTGFTGSNGTNGADGIDGAVGPQGLIGLTGANGADGVDGAIGPQGPTGLTGANGTDGIDGAVGPTGATGPAGTYTAGTGVDITGGVISAVSTAPEYLFVQPDAIVAGYVGFGSASAVNNIPYNSVTDEFTLKAGKTYMLEGAVYMHTTTSSVTYSFVFYDKTNNASIGAEAYLRTSDYSGAVIIQPMMNAIITPVTDIQVGIKDIYGATGGFISSRGFFKVLELK
ncbi:MAG: collagen-like protein, partial [Flavobacteriales bacterium]|nr:collagen-like protein [Flavobacteriales bacterium]